MANSSLQSNNFEPGRGERSERRTDDGFVSSTNFNVCLTISFVSPGKPIIKCSLTPIPVFLRDDIYFFASSRFIFLLIRFKTSCDALSIPIAIFVQPDSNASSIISSLIPFALDCPLHLIPVFLIASKFCLAICLFKGIALSSLIASTSI